MTDPLSPAASYPDPIGDLVLVICTGDGIGQAVVTRFAQNGCAAAYEQEFRNSTPSKTAHQHQEGTAGLF